LRACTTLAPSGALALGSLEKRGLALWRAGTVSLPEIVEVASLEAKKRELLLASREAKLALEKAILGSRRVLLVS